MSEPKKKIKWSPKIMPEKIKRLYDSDAQGVPDEALCDDVGITLYCRVQTIMLADNDKVECPECGTVFSMDNAVGDDPIPCTKKGCKWYTTRNEFQASKRHREIGAGNAAAATTEFYEKYPKARTYKEKILAIDRLIHGFHWDEKVNQPNRSVSNNLIEGNHRQVMEFLDNLSSVDHEVKLKWRETADWMMKRRGGKPLKRKESD